MRIILVVAILSLLSCSSKNSSANSSNTTYKLFYSENGATCLSCLQSKQAAKKIAKELVKDISGFEIINISKGEERELRNQCSLFAGIMMVAEYRGETRGEVYKVDMNEIIIYQENPMDFVNKVSGDIRKFITENRGR